MRRTLRCACGLLVVALIGVVVWVDQQTDPTWDEVEFWMDRR